jgi:glutamyl-tRNA reductase
MPYLACGINYKSAPIELREKFAYDDTQALNLLNTLRSQYGIQEAVLLSTCNRTEIYTSSEHRIAIGSWMHSIIEHLGIHQSQLCYSYQGVEAITHLLRVACGLDSMALGEPQILGQVKKAFHIATEAGTVGKPLQHLFTSVFEASKQVRSQSEICKNPISLAYVVVHLALQTFGALQHRRALIIGIGEITDQIATYFSSHNISMTIANRTLERAVEMADRFGCQAISLDEISEHLNEADIVVSATRSPVPILTKNMIAPIVQKHSSTTKLMIDLAVPRDIDPEAANIDNVKLYYLDDLKSIIAMNYKHREQAAKDAERLIHLQADHFMKNLKLRDESSLIKNYRQELEALRDQEIEKALYSLHNGQDPKTILEQFAHNLLNKIMHKPTIKIRQAAYEGKHDLLSAAKELWEL